METHLLHAQASTTKLTSVRAFAFDLDGTIYLQGTPLPGALELLAALRQAGIPYLFVTNNSSATSDAYLKKLASMGLEPDRSQTLTSNDVAVSHLREQGFRRPYLLATDAVRAEYAQNDLQHDEADPDSVLLTFDTTLDFEKLTLASRFIAAGLPYLATHPDVTCPVPGGFLPDTGSFIELFAAATGREPEILGKPSGFMAAAIRARLGIEAERAGSPAPVRIAFVGDRLYTDVRMANEHGFTAVLTLTGETTHGDHGSSYAPDLVVRDLYELAQHLGLARMEERSA